MDADIIAALNGLLEEERADAEALVGLVAMATDTFERQALTTMGGQAAQGCIDLHERLAHLGAPISGRVSNSVNVVLKHERIDERLRAFAEVQRHLAGRCDALQARNLDDETRALLTALRGVQQAHATWAEHRADEFAATRPTDVESSSPSHAIPQEDHPHLVADETTRGDATSNAPVGEDVTTTAQALDASLAEHLDDVPVMGGRDGQGEPPSDATPSHTDEAPRDTSDMATVELAPPDPLPGTEASTIPPPKPRTRRTRVGAQPVERRPRKQP